MWNTIWAKKGPTEGPEPRSDPAPAPVGVLVVEIHGSAQRHTSCQKPHTSPGPHARLSRPSRLWSQHSDTLLGPPLVTRPGHPKGPGLRAISKFALSAALSSYRSVAVTSTQEKAAAFPGTRYACATPPPGDAIISSRPAHPMAPEQGRLRHLVGRCGPRGLVQVFPPRHIEPGLAGSAEKRPFILKAGNASSGVPLCALSAQSHSLSLRISATATLASLIRAPVYTMR